MDVLHEGNESIHCCQARGNIQILLKKSKLLGIWVSHMQIFQVFVLLFMVSDDKKFKYQNFPTFEICLTGN